MRSWLRWRHPDARPRAARAELDSRDLARAARILAVRSRREASGFFAGSYASAFRGGGIEFEESRPYVPGDDVRNLDWNAFARTGDLFVKRFREERDETVLLALDVSASMDFGTTGMTKATTAAHAAALIAAAAGHAGDRVGFLSFDEKVKNEVPPSRGAAHSWRVIEAVAGAARESTGGTRLEAAIEALLAQARSRAVAMLFSDFRVGSLAETAALRSSFAPFASALMSAGGHDWVAVILYDPHEARLPRAGLVRLRDPEGAGTVLVDSESAAARSRYRRAWALRAASLERRLRAAGSDVLWMRTDRDPLRTLTRFFHHRTHIRMSRTSRARAI
jgi:uncharacterized protein (DUF58 family)